MEIILHWSKPIQPSVLDGINMMAMYHSTYDLCIYPSPPKKYVKLGRQLTFQDATNAILKHHSTYIWR